MARRRKRPYTYRVTLPDYAFYIGVSQIETCAELKRLCAGKRPVAVYMRKHGFAREDAHIEVLCNWPTLKHANHVVDSMLRAYGDHPWCLNPKRD